MTPLHLAIKTGDKLAAAFAVNYNIRIVKELDHRLLNNTSPERDDQEVEQVGFDLGAPVNQISNWSPLHMACATPSLSIITELTGPGAIKVIQLDQSLRTPAQYVEQGYIGSKKASLRAEKECYKRLLAANPRPRLPKNLKLESRRKIELFPRKEEPKPAHPSMNRSIGQLSARSRDHSQNPDPTSNVMLNESINKQTLAQVKKNNSEIGNGDYLSDMNSGISNDLDHKKILTTRDKKYLSGIDNNYLRADNDGYFLGVPRSTKTILQAEPIQHKKQQFDTSIDGPLGGETDRRTGVKGNTPIVSPRGLQAPKDSQLDVSKSLLSQQHNSNIAALVSSFYNKAAVPLKVGEGRIREVPDPRGLVSQTNSDYPDDMTIGIDAPGRAVEEIQDEREKPQSRIKPYLDSGTGGSQHTRAELRKESKGMMNSPPGPRFKSETPLPMRKGVKDSGLLDVSQKHVRQISGFQRTNEVEHPHQSRQPNRGSLLMRPDFNKLAHSKALSGVQKPFEATLKEPDQPVLQQPLHQETKLPRLDVLEMRLVKACTRLASEVDSACKKMAKLAAMSRFATGVSDVNLSSVVLKVTQITKLLNLRSVEMEWTGQFEKIGASKVELPSRQLEEVDKMLGSSLISLGTIAVSLMKTKPTPMPLVQSVLMIAYALLSGTGEYQFLMGSVAGFFRSLHPTFRKFDMSPQPRIGSNIDNERVVENRMSKQGLVRMEKLIGVLACYFSRLVLQNTASITVGSITYLRKVEGDDDGNQGALRELQHTTSIGCPSPMFGLKTPAQARRRSSRDKLMTFTGQPSNNLMMFRNISSKKEKTNSTVNIKPKAS